MKQSICRWNLAAMLALVALGWIAGGAEAQVPHKISYQGLLTDPGGTPINATLTMAFKLYDVSSAGVALYTESQSVTVTNGQFNVLIGSGTALTLPFNVQYYVGVTVDTDLEMAPRQPLAAVPYAIRSATTEALAAGATVPAASITGPITTAQIANNAVTQAKLSPVGAVAGNVLGTNGTTLQWQAANAGTVTSVGTGPGLSGGPITASGTISLAATQLLPTVACTTNFIPKWNGSVWTCAADANGGGTVTSVAATAGGGLATTPAGGITATGSVGIATGGVATAMLADGAVTGVKLAANQQLPTCIIGQIARWTGSNWACGNLPPTIATFDAGIVTGHTSLAIPADGKPVIAYTTTGMARIVKCSSASCSGFASVEVVMGVYGLDISIAIGPDGFPIVAAYGTQGGGGDPALVYLKCSNPGCVGDGGSYRAVDTEFRGNFISLALGSDNLPMMAYNWSVPDQVYAMVAHCPTLICYPGAPFGIPLDTTNTYLGRYTSLAIGTDGFPVISYRDDLNTSLKVAKCSNASCTSGATLTTVDNAADVGEYTSLKIGLDGNPVISYYDRTNGNLKSAKCIDAGCVGSALIVTLDSAGDVGTYTSIAIGADGIPVIAYRDETNKWLKVSKCNNATCNGPHPIAVLDSAGDVGMYPSIAVGTDGMPIISYFDATTNALKVAKCTNTACLQP